MELAMSDVTYETARLIASTIKKSWIVKQTEGESVTTGALRVSVC